MDKLKDMTLGEKIVAGSGVLMLITSFLPWYSVDYGFGTATFNGWEKPSPLWSVLAVLLGVAMAAQVLLTKLGTVELPEKLGNLGWGQVHMIGGIAAAAFVLIKLINESSHLGFGFFLAILCAAGLAFGGFTINKESSAAPTA